MTDIDCFLKAENYAVAARLDLTGKSVDLLKVSAFWRAQALKMTARAAGAPIPSDAAPRRLWRV
jgi:hypothetical protein